MPSLHLPFLLRSDFQLPPTILHLHLLSKYQMILMAHLGGDMSVWQIQENLEGIEPKLWLRGGGGGELVGVVNYYRPIQYYTVRGMKG